MPTLPSPGSAVDDVPWIWAVALPGDGEDTPTLYLGVLSNYNKTTSSLARNQFTDEAFNWHNRLATHSHNYTNDPPHFGRDSPGALCGCSESQDVALVCTDSSSSQTILPSCI